MRNIGLIGAIAAVALSGAAYGGGRRGPQRDFTLDQVEEQWVQERLRHARARRRALARAEITERELAAHREAAAREAARPKSRQERRARERAQLDRPNYEPTRFGRARPKDKSDSLKRMLGKRKRRG